MADIYDVIIVGGGPAGLSAALVLGRACRRVLVIDSGQPRNAAAREMHGYLGHDGIRPRDLLDIGRKEIARYGVEFVQDRACQAESAPKSGDQPFRTGFRIETEKGRSALCRKLLFATGMCDELPDLPGIKECYGVSVHHCPYCDGWEHRGKQLAALGQTASAAAGLGLSLRTWSKAVTVLTNGEALDEKSKTQLKKNGIASCQERIRRFVHEGETLQAVELDSGERLELDAVFFSTTQREHCDLPRKLGCRFEETKTAEVVATSPKKKCTNVPGLFLAGDADGDVQFVIVASAEGATAAVAINRELQDEDQKK